MEVADNSDNGHPSLTAEPFNIQSYLADDGGYLLGWVGSVKCLTPDGDMAVFHVQVGLTDIEVIGMLTVALREAIHSADMPTYNPMEED